MFAFAGISLALTSWRAPWTRVWANETGEYVLAIAPNPRTKGWQMRMSSPGPDAIFRPMWQTATDFYPGQAYLSGDGHLVTINEYPGYAHRNAVVIFGDDGKILKRYVVEDLIPKAEFDALPGNEGLMPKHWAEAARFESILNRVDRPKVQSPPVDRRVGGVAIHNEFPLAFYLKTVTGKILWFDLVTGNKVEG